ncbi:MAG: DoxX family protein [Cyanobacteria bacterium P01_G01_bin.38]
MLKHRFADYSLLLLRLMVVFIFLYHGLPKAINWPLAMQKFVDMGFPGFLGPITGIVEVIASVLILLGLYSKLSNLLLAVIMAGAIAGVHIPASLAQATVTAGLERDLMILVGVLVLAAFGPGILSLSSSRSVLES